MRAWLAILILAAILSGTASYLLIRYGSVSQPSGINESLTTPTPTPIPTETTSITTITTTTKTNTLSHTTTTTTPKPDALQAYLQSKGWSYEYALFKPMLKDGKLSSEEKQLINYWNELPKKYRSNEEVLDLLEKIISDGKLTDNEFSAFRDWDSDGLSNLQEIDKYHTNPLKADTDEDGLTDGFEVKNGLNPLKANPNIAYLLSKGLSVNDAKITLALDIDGKMQVNEKSFDNLLLNYKNYLIINTLTNYLKNEASDGVITNDELAHADNFSGLVKELYSVINSESKAKDKISDTDYAAELALQLSFDKTKATKATGKAIGEYAMAVKDEGLPEELRALSLLTQGMQIEKYGDKLVDFSPIIFKSVDGNDYVLRIDAPGDTWMLARQIKLLQDNGYEPINHPEWFESLNAKIIADAWSLFDAKYGISYMEKTINHQVIKPTDKDVWDLIQLQWQLYSKASKGKYYNRDFPWRDSDKLDKLYADKNTRRQTELFLFYLPGKTWDMDKQKIVFGVDAADTALKQAFSEYEKISYYLDHPNENVPKGYKSWNDLTEERWNQWLCDRFNHGLAYTVGKFVGLSDEQVKELEKTWIERSLQNGMKTQMVQLSI